MSSLEAVIHEDDHEDYMTWVKMFGGVKEGDHVLLIWSGNVPPKQIEEIVHQLNSLVGSSGKVAVEHEERLKFCKYM